MIFNLRGPYGSGKSWVVEQLMERFGSQLVDSGHYIPKLNLYVVGEYGKGQCGGCDNFSGLGEIMALVDKYAAKGHVLFEGVMLSMVFQSWLEWGRGRMVWMFLDTSLQLCERRMAERSGRVSQQARKRRGQKYRDIMRIRRKVQFHGEPMEIIRHQHALPDLIAVLKKYGAG